MNEVENPQGKEMILAGERMWVEAQWAGDMQEAIERVRELHKPIKNNEVLAWWYDKYKPEDLFCVECMQNSDSEYSTSYPCPTIKALDSEQ